jgi:ABC-type transport system substrate-binding protein
MAIDRVQLVKDALNGHGVPSAGPIWPRYWAVQRELPTFGFDPAHAAQIFHATGAKVDKSGLGLRFTCLVPPDPVAERIALELKRQFAPLGVDMNVRASSPDEILDAERHRRYEAVLIDGVSGPTLLRPYQLWHSRSAANPGGGIGNRSVDAAFDRVRYADTEATFRDAVAQLQAAFMDDPPAIFLAWTERARAVSRHFDVPAVEPGGDILRNLRLWKPVTHKGQASRN